jgi:hypothetical protein
MFSKKLSIYLLLQYHPQPLAPVPFLVVEKNHSVVVGSLERIPWFRFRRKARISSSKWMGNANSTSFCGEIGAQLSKQKWSPYKIVNFFHSHLMFCQ